MADAFLNEAAAWQNAAGNLATGDVEARANTALNLFQQAIAAGVVPTSRESEEVIGLLSGVTGQTSDWVGGVLAAGDAVQSANTYYELSHNSGSGNDLVDSIIRVSTIPAQIVAALDTVINSLNALGVIPGSGPILQAIATPLVVLKQVLQPIAELVTENATAAQKAFTANLFKFGQAHMISGSTTLTADFGHALVLDGVKMQGGSVPQSSTSNGTIWGVTFTGYEGASYTTSPGGTVAITQGPASVSISGWGPNELKFNITTTPSNPGGGQQPQPAQYGSPLVLDLDGDGVEAFGLTTQVVFFDIDKDGIAERTGWVGADDGLLAIDLDGDGQIGSAAELFGAGRTISKFDDGTMLDSPQGTVLDSAGDYATYGSGFGALAIHDDNGDGVIDAGDEAFALLRVWRDANTDGDVDEGELMGLTEAGVASISLGYAHTPFEFGGNLVTDTSSFTTTAGDSRAVYDVWFEFDQRAIRYDRPDDIPETILSLPQLGPQGAIKDLHVAMYEDAILEELVREAVGLTDLADWSGMGERILARWAGVDHVDPTSRATTANAQHIAVLEKLKDTPFQQSEWQFAGPGPNAGGALENEWSMLHRDVTAGLLLQTPLGHSLFPELELLPGGTLAVAADASLDTMLARLEAAAPASMAERAAFWQTALRVLDGTSYVMPGYDREHFMTRVELSLANQGLDLGYDDVAGGLAGSDLADAMVMQGTTGTEFVANDFWKPETRLIVTGAGDDTVIFTTNDAAVFWGAGQGDDTLRLTMQFEEIPASASAPIQGNYTGTRLFLRLDDLTRAEVSAVAPLEPNTPFVLVITATGETLTIEPPRDSEFYSPGRIWVQFADQTIDLSELYIDILPDATAGDDVLRQKATLPMDGGAGDDLLQGSFYAQTVYQFDIGSGHDTIVDRAASMGTHKNQIVFGPGVRMEDIRLARDLTGGADLLISLSGASDTLTIANQFADYGNSGHHAIESFVVEGIEHSAQAFEQRLLMEEAGQSVRHGTDHSDTFLLDESAIATEIHGWGGGDSYIFSSRPDDFDASDARSFRVIDTFQTGLDRIIVNEALEDLDMTLTDAALTIVVRRNGDALVLDAPRLFDDFTIGGRRYTFETLKDEMLRAGLIDSGGAILGTIDPETIDGANDADVIYAFAGDDVINGLDGDDAIYAGDGIDTVEGGEGDDLIVLSDDEYAIAGPGETARGGGGGDTITGSPLNDVLEGGAGDDLIRAGYGNDDHRGGAGDDILDDIYGADLYRFAQGDGADVIGEADWFASADTIELSGGLSVAAISAGAVTLAAETRAKLASPVLAPYALKLDFGGGDSITIQDSASMGRQFADIAISDGGGGAVTTQALWASVNAPTAADQTIVQANGETEYETGAGDDTFVTLFSTIRFSWGVGDGDDIIVNDWTFNPYVGDGVVAFRAGVAPGDVSFSIAGANLTDLVVHLASGDTLTIRDQFHQAAPLVGLSTIETLPLISTFVFADGSTEDIAQIRSEFASGAQGVVVTFDDADTISAVPGVSHYAGGSGGDGYHFGPGDGDAVIQETAFNGASGPRLPLVDPETSQPGPLGQMRAEQEDTLHLNAAPGEVTVATDGNNLLITFITTGETIRIVGQLNPATSFGSIDPATAAALPEALAALLGQDGQVTQAFWNATAPGSDASYAELFGGAPLFSAGIEYFAFSDGTVLNRNQILDIAGSIATAGADTLSTDGAGGVMDGGEGDDALLGGAGPDSYVLGFLTGDDIARDAGGSDRLTFGEGIRPENVMFTRTGPEGDDLLVEVDGIHRSAMTIQGQFSTGEIESFVFEDGTVYSAAGVRQIIIDGLVSETDDVLIGFDGPDVFDTRGGDDTAEGREGDDTFLGGSGMDTAVFRGAASDYAVTATTNGFIVTDRVGDEGSDTLIDVERLRFLDARDGSADAASVVELVANEAPTAGARAFTLSENRVLRLRDTDLIALGGDANGDALSLQSVSGAVNGAIVRGGGMIVFTPDSGFNGEALFHFTLADQGGLTAGGLVTIHYTGQNDAPTVANPIADQSSPEDAPWSFTLPADAFADADGPSMILSATQQGGAPLPAWLTFDAESRTFSGAPPLDFNGSVEVTVTASDGSLSASDTFRLDITPVNDAPAAPGYALSLDEDGFAPLEESTISDPDSDALTIAVKTGAGPNHGVIETDAATGALIYRPDADFFGVDTATLTVSDGENTVEQVVGFTIAGVNDDIRGFGATGLAILENSAAGTVVGVLNGVDPDGAAISFAVDPSSPGAALFEVSGSDVIVRNGALIDRETLGASVDLVVTATSAGGPYIASAQTETFGVAIGDAPEAPTSLQLAAGPLTENSAVGVVIGSLSATDQDAGESFTYQLAAGAGDADNARVSIVGSDVQVNGSIDFETNPTLELRIRAIDSTGRAIEAPFVIAVADVIESSPGGGTPGDDNAVSGVPRGVLGQVMSALFPEAFRGLRGTARAETIDGLAGDDVVFGFGGGDTIYGGAGADRIYGDTGKQPESIVQWVLFRTGMDGDDHLFGGGGDDFLYGGGGSDDLNGGAGRDILEGGAGGDRFIFDDGDSSPSARDRIEDFSRSEGDLIDLRLIDANPATAADDGLTLVAGQAAALATIGAVYLGPRAGGVQNVSVNTDVARAGFELTIEVVAGRALGATDLLL